MTDPIVQFIDAMRGAGIVPLEPISDGLLSGSLIRFRAEGDKAGRKNGWAKLNLDEHPAGAFGHHRLNVHQKWKSGLKSKPLSDYERQAFLSRIKEQEASRQEARRAEQARIAREAYSLWNASPASDPAHPYMLNKGLLPLGIKQDQKHLLVPMVDEQWRLWNLQRIYSDGKKRFRAGARTKGLFWSYGVNRPDDGLKRGPIVIGEGFATMLAIHHATGLSVVASFSAGNLLQVALTMRSLFPHRTFIIAADDDSHLPRNTGLEAAQKAAEAIGALLAIPRRSREEVASDDSSIQHEGD